MIRRALLIAAVSSLTATAADATILTFEIDNTNGLPIPMNQAYGDNVVALAQGGATYGVGAEGFTPDITAAYAGGGPGANLIRWDIDYGDLFHILENEDDGDTLLQVSFNAEAGQQVVLYGFDLGGWPRTDYVIPEVTVVGEGGMLFSQSDVLVQGDGFGPQHTTFDFGAGLFGGSNLTINIDLSGLGDFSDSIGIDNVRFGQEDLGAGPIPEPGAWALMILGFGAVGSMLRSRRRALA